MVPALLRLLVSPTLRNSQNVAFADLSIGGWIQKYKAIHLILSPLCMIEDTNLPLISREALG